MGCQEMEETEKHCKGYYLGIRYEEKGSDAVPVYLPGGECGERTCEYSRYKEGFCIEIVDCCQEKSPPGLLKGFCECQEGCEPKTAMDSDCWCCETLREKITKCREEISKYPKEEQKKIAEKQAQLTDLKAAYCRCLRLAEFCEESVPCHECCSCGCHHCHVVLGKVEVDEKGCICKVCINECREYVLTGPMLKHLIVSILAGSENAFAPPLPPAESIAANPIGALCSYLRLSVIGIEKETKLTRGLDDLCKKLKDTSGSGKQAGKT
jgi:hypothetical protein